MTNLVHEWQDINFSDESMFYLQHQDGCIRVRKHCGERTLAAYNCHRHTSQSSDMMVWDAIGYTSQLPFVRIDGPLNSPHYIFGALRPVVLHFFRLLRNPTFKRIMQDRMLPILYGPSLIRKMFHCCPGMHIHQIFHQQKTSGLWLLSDWIVT
ncbi:transposable element Tcb1 transposase [Trichonephila clavipes]|uniref:Transposable element Tcb1 transposase n=1 Tax=Trichonephila clavipes TaxID=2585209 RepID=A0A8X6SZ04_TRICX|nr:transposable element Tcb1 transposase [Trichonephila clavipes]